jgi:chaperonin GroES
MERLEPLGDKVIVKPVTEETMSKGGIIIPDTAKEKPQEGEIIAVGPGRVDKAGKKVAMDVKVGDRVIFGKYTGSEIKIEGEKYLIMPESDILAITGKAAKSPAKGKKNG